MHEAKAIDVAWSTAADIAAAVAAGRSTAESVVSAALARIRECDPRFNAFTAVTEERALARARALDEARARREALPPLAGVPFAVKNLFDIAGLPTLAGSKINRDAPPAKRDATIIERLEAGRRRPGRRAQHGRIRLRLHRREHPRRPVAQSARSRAHDRRLVRRFGRRGRGRAGAAGARLRHQRLDPRAGFAVRLVRAQADLWTAERARTPFRSLRASTMSGRSHAARATSRSPTMPCRAPTPTIRCAPSGRPSRSRRASDAGRRWSAHRRRGRIFQGPRRRRPVAAVDRVAAALGADREIEIPEAERARAAAFVITASEGRERCTSTGCATRATRFRSRGARPADRRRHGAGRAGDQGTEIPALVPRARCSSCSRRSTRSWRRRRPARRR